MRVRRASESQGGKRSCSTITSSIAALNFFSEETEVSRQGFSRGHPRAGAEAAQDPVPTESSALLVCLAGPVWLQSRLRARPRQERTRGWEAAAPALSAVTPQPGTAPSQQEVLQEVLLPGAGQGVYSCFYLSPRVKWCLFLSPFQSRDSFYLIKKAASQDPAASTSWRINRPEHSVVPETIVWS